MTAIERKGIAFRFDSMARYRLPTPLVHMTAARRVIPFIGAGASSAVGLPTWNELLKTIAAEIAPDLPFDALSDSCTGDYLRMAEYLFLRAHKEIGPLRYHISRALDTDTDVSMSTVHVELVNLGARLVYTTNYDNLIEDVYRRLNVP